MITAQAPGKIILFGEHAVVYGQPALAAPVLQVAARADVQHQTGRSGVWLDAQDLHRRYPVDQAPESDPLAAAVRWTFAHFRRPLSEANLTITLGSSIPPAAGLGSGAAVCTAIVRVLACYFQAPITPAEVAAIVFETEKLLHGTPSGVDNTVIAYEQPVYFIKGQPPVPFAVGQAFDLLIADTGLASPTKVTVGDVRSAWQQEPARYEALFQAIGAIVQEARGIIEHGDPAHLGPLMNRNHALLQTMGVSCLALDELVQAARSAGALGAKLSGGGRGGNMLALVRPDSLAAVQTALVQAGARRVLSTRITPHPV